MDKVCIALWDPWFDFDTTISVHATPWQMITYIIDRISIVDMHECLLLRVKQSKMLHELIKVYRHALSCTCPKAKHAYT